MQAQARRFYTVGRLLFAAMCAAVFFRSVWTPLEAFYEVQGIGRIIRLFGLVMHEAGHVLAQPFGEFFTILGGSLWEIAVPLIFVIYFMLSRQAFAASILLFFVAFGLADASVYVGDARERSLPLLGGGTEGHDWGNLLIMLKLIAFDDVLARLFYIEGLLVYILACGLSFYYAGKLPAGS